MGAITDLI